MAGTSLAVALLLARRGPDVRAEHAGDLAGVPCHSMWGKWWSGRGRFCCRAGAMPASLSSAGITATTPLLQQNLRVTVQAVNQSNNNLCARATGCLQ